MATLTLDDIIIPAPREPDVFTVEDIDPEWMSDRAVDERIAAESVPRPMGLAERAGKQFANQLVLEKAERARPGTGVAESLGAMADIQREFEKQGVPDGREWSRMSTTEKIRNIPRMWWAMTKGYFAPEEDVKEQMVQGVREMRGDVTFDVPEAQTIPEKAVDIGASTAAFIGELMLAKKIMPDTLPKGLSNVLSWELSSRANGSAPGVGAAQAMAFHGIQAVPGQSAIAQIGKLALESGALAGIEYTASGDEQRAMVAALLPLPFAAYRAGFSRRLKSVKTLDELSGLVRDAETIKQRHDAIRGYVDSLSPEQLQTVRTRRAESYDTNPSSRAIVDLIDLRIKARKVAERPEVAEQVIEQPSRRNIEKAGVKPSEAPTAEERTALARQVQRELADFTQSVPPPTEQQPASAPPAPAPARPPAMAGEQAVSFEAFEREAAARESAAKPEELRREEIQESPAQTQGRQERQEGQEVAPQQTVPTPPSPPSAPAEAAGAVKRRLGRKAEAQPKRRLGRRSEAGQTEMLRIHDKYKDIISPERDRVGMEGFETEAEMARFQTGFAFNDTPQGRSLAKELKDRLPPELHRHVKVRKGERTGVDAQDAGLSADEMAEAIIRAAEQSPRRTAERTAEFILQHEDMFQAEEIYAAQKFRQIAGDPESAANLKKVKPEIVSSEELAPGQKMKIAGEEYKVAEVTEDAVLLEDGITLQVPMGKEVAIDKGTLSKPKKKRLGRKVEPEEGDIDFPFGANAPAESAKTTNLFGERTFEPMAGQQKGLEFGRNLEGETVTESGAITPEGKFRPDVDKAAEARLAAENAREGQGTLDMSQAGIASRAMGAGVDLSSLIEQAVRGGKKLKSLARRELTSRGHLPEEIFHKEIERKARLRTMLRSMEHSLRDFRRAAREVYGTGKLDVTELALIDDVLKGAVPSSALKQPLRGVVERMRDEVDTLSRELIASGAVEGKVVATIRKNLGTYLTRSYRVFDDPKWAENVPEPIRNRAKAFIRTEWEETLAKEWSARTGNPDLNGIRQRMNAPGTPENQYREERVAGIIENLLYEGKAAEGPIALLRGRKLGSKDLTILMRRKDIPVEIRDLWGEYHDPRINYARSMAKMAHLITNHEFLTAARTAGLGRFFHVQPVANESGEFKTRIAADESSPMRPLNGLYTTPEIKFEFDQAYGPGTQNELLKLYMQANGFVKFGKTVLSPMTTVRNWLGNVGFAVAQGHFRAGRFNEATMGTWGDLAGNAGRWRDYAQEAQRYGVLLEGARSGELRAVIKDAFEAHSSDPSKHGILKFTAKLAQGIYKGGDDFWKLYAWENEKARYRKAFPQWTDEQVKQRAAEIVRNTYPTYELAPRGVKRIRHFPLVGTFPTFSAEVVRVGYHTIGLAMSELRNPQTRSIGAQRLAGMAVALGMTAALAAAFRSLLGISREDDEDFREFVPPWSQNSPILFLGKTDKGIRWIDVGYSDPWSYLKEPFIAALRGDDWTESLKNAAWALAEPFAGEEILAGKLLDAWRNTKADGGPVYNPQSDFPDKMRQVLVHIGEAFEPGVSRSLRRIQQGIAGEVAPSGKVYDPAIEATAMVTGQRILETDLVQSLGYRARKFDRELSEAGRMLNSVLASRGKVSDADLIEAWEDADRARRRLFDDMREAIRAATRLGVTRQEIVQATRNAGLSQEMVARLLNGDYETYAPSTQFVRTLGRSHDTAELRRRLQVLAAARRERMAQQ